MHRIPLSPVSGTAPAHHAGTSRPVPAPNTSVQVLNRLADLASEHASIQDRLAALRDERDALILKGFAHGVSSAQLAATSKLTGARVRAIADAAAASSARDRVARAVARLAEHKPALCTTYGALAEAVGIGSAKGVASSLATNPDVPSSQGARVLLLRWASPALGGYVIPSEEAAWQTQGDDTSTRLECLNEAGLVQAVNGPAGQQTWIVPFERVCADPCRLAQILAE